MQYAVIGVYGLSSSSSAAECSRHHDTTTSSSMNDALNNHLFLATAPHPRTIPTPSSSTEQPPNFQFQDVAAAQSEDNSAKLRSAAQPLRALRTSTSASRATKQDTKRLNNQSVPVTCALSQIQEKQIIASPISLLSFSPNVGHAPPIPQSKTCHTLQTCN